MTRAVVFAALAGSLLLQPAVALIRGRTPEDSVVLHNPQLQLCPLSCDFAGADPETWTTYHNYEGMANCHDTILFTLNVHAKSDTRIKACSTTRGGPHMHAGAYYGLLQNNITDSPSPEIIAHVVLESSSSEAEVKVDAVGDATGSGSCGLTPREISVEVESKWSAGETGTTTPEKLSQTLSQLESYIRNKAGCGSSLMLARTGNSVVGAFVGGDLAKEGAADLVSAAAKSMGTFRQYATQACRASGTTEPAFDTRFGLFADLSGNASSVQAFMSTYLHELDGKCVDFVGLESKAAPATTKLIMLGSSFTGNSTGKATSSNGTLSATHASNKRGLLHPRAYCRDIQLVSQDTCGKLAERCQISGNDFMKYNPKTNLCSTLMPKQYVCCSSGDLQDHRPQPNPDGTCQTYTVQPDDGCWKIADSFGIDVARLEEVNKATFGFAGCAHLQKQQVICISSGDPPMPAQDTAAVCGPWVLGTKRPSNYSDVANLNPCPLKACCDVWAQCGTTAEFCTKSEIDGRVGTAKPGTNGCISNCGMGITGNWEKPSSFARVGYFEGFNKDRKCLHMDITQFDTKTFTHIHFAFATISNDYQVLLPGKTKEQFDKMVKMDAKGTKKVLSFGGWSFSTDYDTAPIFARSVSSTNRLKFAENVVKFLEDNKLDGLDFDWEYPGATDIPGSVPGNDDDGKNYLEFLKQVKRRLPTGKTLSIALPASYWYLKNFPVADMAKVCDYFIYMTYDLHGQWDYSSKWANPGCPPSPCPGCPEGNCPGCPMGNCLRSHVNMTETRDSLAMVTKAGVSAKQIFVGVASYGRSFKMEDPRCRGPTCKFTGSFNVSHAEPGVCTGQGGYISEAEIRRIILQDELEEAGMVKTYFDGDSQSDLITWGDGNWAAWMDGPAKINRIEWVERLNFGGTTDWAVDLQHFNDPIPGDTSQGELIVGTPGGCTLEFDDLAHVSQYASAGLIPSWCRATYVIGALGKLLGSTINAYNDVKNNYDGKFGRYAEYVKDLVEPTLERWMDNWETDTANKKGLGNKYFDCKMKYDEWDKNWAYQGPCPVPKKLMEDALGVDPEHGYVNWIIEYTLRDKKGYEDALMEDLGMDSSWVKWGQRDDYPECYSEDLSLCAITRHHWLRGDYPRRADNVNVPDPKAVWDKAIPEMDKLRGKLATGMLSVGMGLYDPKFNEDDAAIALAVPIQMLAQAAHHMSEVKDISNQIEEREKKERILLIVSIVLMVIPFVGEIGAVLAGLGAVARFAFVAGEIANAAFSIYEIVDDPSSAPYAIMGMLLGAAGRGKRAEEAFEESAKARRLMKTAHVAGMGKRFREIDDQVQLAIKSCGRM
ncbi:hypothetical protein B0T16DRAFT_453662 [Cercophora newfieldiana]|uniref:chitinase n=1 Tax=Cercophora newfieldiana TaxID=92897 RepID=A0AA39YFY7_9PEZI|nr:hypothetical protein B0T16DRAFT_453662 [Cercophora newfieldiana]